MARNRYVIVTTTVDNEAAAASLANAIVERRLAACVQYAPIRSVYRWKGKVESSSEFRLAAKTRAALAAPLQAFLRASHAYELPEIVVTPIAAGLPAYLAWVENETLTLRDRPTRKALRIRGRTS